MSNRRSTIRVILSIAAVFAIMIGFLGFFSSAYSSISNADRIVERFDTQFPLHEINGVAVDSKGNLYYGTSQHSAIQVYDNHGVFLYGFLFPTGGAGYFAFYIDDNDIIHIATSRTSSTYSFQYGKLIEAKEYADGQEASDTIHEYKEKSLNAYEFRDESGNIYRVTVKDSIKMFDAAGEYIRTVSPDAPLWPFSIFGFWGIGAAGMGALFLANKKFFIGFFKTNSHTVWG